MNKTYTAIKNLDNETIIKYKNEDKLVQKIELTINAITDFYKLNNIEITDLIRIDFYELFDNIKYVSIDFSEYDYNFIIDGIVNYNEFINKLNKLSINMLRLNDKVFILLDTKKNKMKKKV